MHRVLLTKSPLARCAAVALSVVQVSPLSSLALGFPRTKTNTCNAQSFAAMATAEESASSFTVVQFPCLSDNYGYLLHDPATGHTAAVDTPDATPYRNELERRGWKLTHIFNTHHHWDHTGGNVELKTPGVVVVGPADEKGKIPGIDVAVKGGDVVDFGSTKAQILSVGGHTKGHIAYYFPSESKVFVGDALFAMGCGRMFEGTAAQFWESLLRLRALPDDTLVYCAHEYTLSNGKFAMSVEPGNSDLRARFEDVKAARSRGEPTVPTSIGIEKRTNPFLRCDISDELRSNIHVDPGEPDAVAFGKCRSAKDNFRG